MALERNVEELLNIWNNGKNLAENFLNERLVTKEKLFYAPIPRVKVPSFNLNKVKVVTNKEVKVIEANRNILGRLLSLSTKHNRVIGLESVLTYPLYPVPLSLANPDGTKRSTQKSKLLEIFDNTEVNVEVSSVHESVLIVDMIAQLRLCITGATGTFEDLIKRFFNSLPAGYKRVDIVGDTYRNNSIKAGERKKRGTSEKIIIGSVKSRLPNDMTEFMLNNENKTTLITMILEYSNINKAYVLTKLKGGSSPKNYFLIFVLI